MTSTVTTLDSDCDSHKSTNQFASFKTAHAVVTLAKRIFIAIREGSPWPRDQSFSVRYGYSDDGTNFPNVSNVPARKSDAVTQLGNAIGPENLKNRSYQPPYAVGLSGRVANSTVLVIDAKTVSEIRALRPSQLSEGLRSEMEKIDIEFGE